MNSWSFEAFFTFVIFTNSVFIGVEVHFMAHNPGPPPTSFFVVDQVYAGVFFIELALRILAEGKSFFWSSPNMAWNYLDILINITSVLNIVTAIVQQGEGDSDTLRTSGNVRIIRILRLTRVIRVVRVVKIVRFIRALRSLVYSIFGTLKVLLWSVLLLLMIMCLEPCRARVVSSGIPSPSFSWTYPTNTGTVTKWRRKRTSNSSSDTSLTLKGPSSACSRAFAMASTGQMWLTSSIPSAASGDTSTCSMWPSVARFWSFLSWLGLSCRATSRLGTWLPSFIYCYAPSAWVL